MVSIVPLQRRTEASPARSIFSLERRRREEGEGRGGMDLSGTQGELPIPMHAAASSYRNSGEGSAGGHVLQVHHEHGNNNNGHESPAQIEAANSGKKRATVGAASSGSGGSAVKYRECLKNHAAAMGGNATDGCGEFMPSGEEGSLDALMCSACGCHRNFHRKEVDDMDAEGCAGHGYGHRAGRRLIAPAMPHHKNGGGGGGLLVAADPYCAYAAMRAVAPSPPGHPLHHQQFLNAMPLSAMHTSESDEMDGSGGHGMSAAARGSGSSSSKKRFRTKFTPEQKARMLDFAEHVGWRLQKLDDGMVQAFCQEIGVKRRVLKVWMHNNKHNLATKRLEAPPEAAVASPPQPHVPMSMMPPPQQPSSQAGPSFNRGGPSSPPPQMPMPMVPPPPFHRSPGSPSPLKLD